MREIDISYRGILRVAIPISLGSFAQFVVVITDNYFLGQVHMNAMNGAGNSALIYVTILMFAIGISSATQILVARKNGEKNFPEAGSILVNVLLIMIFAGVGLYGLLEWINFSLLPQVIRSEDVLDNMQRFLNIRALGMLVYPLALVLLSFYAGIARTMVMLYATILTAGINILLDWTLIFGHFSFEAMGIEGAAWATVSAECSSLIFLAFYLVWDKKNRKFALKKAWSELSFKHSKQIFKIGLPISAQQMLSLATWTVFFFLIEKLGEQSLQSSHVVRSMYLLAFISIMGISQTTKTYISTLIAEKRQAVLRTTIRRLIVINLVGVFVLTHGLWLYPEFIGGLFSQDPEVIMLTKKSLLVVLPAMLLACFSSVILNTIEGAGKTMVALWLEIAAVVTYIVLTAALTIWKPMPVYIVWTNDYSYFGILAVLGGLFLKYGKWKEVSL